MQLLTDTGINAFAAKLLAESWNKVPQKTKDAIPNPCTFTIGKCEITLRNFEETRGSGTCSNKQCTYPENRCYETVITSCSGHKNEHT